MEKLKVNFKAVKSQSQRVNRLHVYCSTINDCYLRVSSVKKKKKKGTVGILLRIWILKIKDFILVLYLFRNKKDMGGEGTEIKVRNSSSIFKYQISIKPQRVL